MICISMVKIRILYIWAIKCVNDSKCVSGHQPFVFLNLALTMTQCESSLSGRLQLQGPTTTGGMCNTLAVKKLRWPRGSQWVEAARGAVGRWLRTHRLCWQWMLMQRCQSNVCWVKALKQKRQSWEWCKFFKKRHTHTRTLTCVRAHTHTHKPRSHTSHTGKHLRLSVNLPKGHYLHSCLIHECFSFLFYADFAISREQTWWWAGHCMANLCMRLIQALHLHCAAFILLL